VCSSHDSSNSMSQSNSAARHGGRALAGPARRPQTPRAGRQRETFCAPEATIDAQLVVHLTPLIEADAVHDEHHVGYFRTPRRCGRAGS